MQAMVDEFSEMGLLEVLKGVAGDKIFPEKMLVASFGPGVALPDPPLASTLAAAAPATPVTVTPGAVLRRRAFKEAGWASEEGREETPFPIHHPERK